MLGLIKLVRVLGLRNIVRLIKAKRTGGELLVRGFFATPSIIALFNIGFFETLTKEKQVNIKSFADRENLNYDVLKPLCEYLYSLGYLNKSGQIYTLSSRGNILTDVLAGTFQIMDAYSPVFHNLEPLLKGELRYGVDIEKDAALSAQGSGQSGKLLMFPVTRALIRDHGFKKVLDIGCGDGTFLIDLCKSDKSIMGYGLDMSQKSIDLGRKNVRENGLDDRIELFTEDMFNIHLLEDQLKAIDAATIFFVLHEMFRDETDRVIGFLRMFKKMFPSASLIVCEAARLSPEQIRKRGGPLAEFQLSHDLTGQHTLSRDEWKSLFKQAGFNKVEETYLHVGSLVVYAIQ